MFHARSVSQSRIQGEAVMTVSSAGRGSRLGRLHVLAVALVMTVVAAAPALAQTGPIRDLSATELGATANVARMIGADDMWAHGHTGQGIDVAVIDTGIVPVQGLDAPGKVVLGPDLSFESQAPDLEHLDTYGHGTAMASIIAGRDAAGDAPFRGIAPDARIVSVKVGAATGAVDVSQVVAAIDWVVAHRRSGGLDIRVINLSYGTDSTQSAALDPLAHAVTSAWRNGIVVVVATGNDGRGTQLAMPAAARSIIAVGAADHRGTLAVTDDRPAGFSTYADGWRRPDLLAPGVGVVGLRAEGSQLDQLHPQAVRAERFFRGSGTSQAAAVTSGAAALLLSQRPDLTPDEVKALLQGTAFSLMATSNNAQGSGLVDLRAARVAPVPRKLQRDVTARVTGLGSLDAARGSATVSADGVELRGERDIFGAPWVADRWAPLSTAGAAWSEGTWNGSRWTGADWAADEADWAGSRWTGSRWTGSRWTGSRWTGSRWTSASWTGGAWDDPAWTGSRWTGSRWTFADGAEVWDGSRWTGSRWTGSRWTGSRWTSWAATSWE
jgi:serine protease AprX